MKKNLLNNQAQSSKLKAQSSPRGFTMVELVIAIGLLTMILFTASSTFVTFFESVKTIRAQNLVYEEARFLMERIAREVRSGTIDYEEYYNQHKFTTNPQAEDEIQYYGGNDQDSYCRYGLQFFLPGPDGDLDTFEDNQIVGKIDPLETPINGIQNKLYLVNGEGNKRTYFRRAEFLNTLTPNDSTDTVGKVVILKLVGRDYGKDHILASNLGCDPDVGEGDGFIDTWECESGFNCTPSNQPCGSSIGSADAPHEIFFHPDPTQSAFVDITPETLDIVDLQFTITPVNDPRKAFDDIDAYQVQPHVTIKMIARANERISNEIISKRPKISLVTTISARANQEIRTVCLP